MFKYLNILNLAIVSDFGFRASDFCATHGSFDLHVLGTPPAFILSQDQTLKIFGFPLRIKLRGISSICCTEIELSRPVRQRRDNSVFLQPRKNRT